MRFSTKLYLKLIIILWFFIKGILSYVYKISDFLNEPLPLAVVTAIGLTVYLFNEPFRFVTVAKKLEDIEENF